MVLSKILPIEHRILNIEIDNCFKNLPFPWIKPYDIELKVEGLKGNGTYDLVINGSVKKDLTTEDLKSYRLVVNKLPL
jgi:CO dehydrogenase/acetyl-CoA synthase epsilon subunit